MEVLSIGINVIYLVCIIFSLVQIYSARKKLGASSVGVVFGFFFTVIILLAGIRLLFFLVDFQLIDIEEMTLTVAWHMIFYIATGLWFLSARTLLGLVGRKGKKTTSTQVVGWSAASLILMGIIIIGSAMNNNQIASMISHSWWDTSGIFHFVAFFLAAAVALFLFRIKKQFASTLGIVSAPLMVVVAVLALIHGWELMTESWRVVVLDGEIIEAVEMGLWVPVYAGAAYAFWRLRKVLELR